MSAEVIPFPALREPEPAFAVGNIVRLRSGGPAMLVCALVERERGIVATWCSGPPGQLRWDVFPEWVLDVVVEG